MPDYLDAADAQTLDATRSADDELALVRDLPLRFAPGTRYSYSSSGYLLLGAIVARVGGAPWEQNRGDHVAMDLGAALVGGPDRLLVMRMAWVYRRALVALLLAALVLVIAWRRRARATVRG